MNPILDSLSSSTAGPAVLIERNLLQRDTDWLLALLLVPTVLCALIGGTLALHAPCRRASACWSS